MKRFGYSFRCGTHIGQSINEDALKNASLFWNKVHNTIKENDLVKYNIFKNLKLSYRVHTLRTNFNVYGSVDSIR